MCVCVALSVCFVLPCFVVSTSLRAQINYTHTHARIHIRHFSRLLLTLPLTKSIALSLSHTHTGHVQAKDHDPQICRAPQARRDGKASTARTPHHIRGTRAKPKPTIVLLNQQQTTTIKNKQSHSPRCMCVLLAPPPFFLLVLLRKSLLFLEQVGRGLHCLYITVGGN